MVKNNLTYIGFWIIILGELIFSKYSIPQNTNWTIFYFGSFYFGISCICLSNFLVYLTKIDKMYWGVFYIYFILMTANLLFYINIEYNTFMNAINNSYIDKGRFLMLGASGILISLKLFVNEKKFRRAREDTRNGYN